MAWAFVLFWILLMVCFVNNFLILTPREWLKIQHEGHRTKKTWGGAIRKIGQFWKRLLGILISQGEIENTIREISKTIRLSADSLIVSADRIRKKMAFFMRKKRRLGGKAHFWERNFRKIMKFWSISRVFSNSEEELSLQMDECYCQ